MSPVSGTTPAALATYPNRCNCRVYAWLYSIRIGGFDFAGWVLAIWVALLTRVGSIEQALLSAEYDAWGCLLRGHDSLFG